MVVTDDKMLRLFTIMFHYLRLPIRADPIISKSGEKGFKFNYPTARITMRIMVSQNKVST